MLLVIRRLILLFLSIYTLDIYGHTYLLDSLKKDDNIDSICSCNCFNIDSSKIDSRQTFLIVEESATFQNGNISDFRDYIQTCLNDFNKSSMDKKDKVIIQFAIDIDGTLTDIKVLKCNNVYLAKETIICMKGSPKWTPGRDKGKNVKQMFTMPIISNYKK